MFANNSGGIKASILSIWLAMVPLASRAQGTIDTENLDAARPSPKKAFKGTYTDLTSPQYRRPASEPDEIEKLVGRARECLRRGQLDSARALLPRIMACVHSLWGYNDYSSRTLDLLSLSMEFSRSADLAAARDLLLSTAKKDAHWPDRQSAGQFEDPLKLLTKGYLDAGQFDNAECVLVEFCRLYEAGGTKSGAKYLQALTYLALFYLENKRLDKFESLTEKIIQTARAEQSDTYYFLDRLARLSLAAGELDFCEALYGLPTAGPAKVSVGAYSELASSYAEKKNFAKAEATWRIAGGLMAAKLPGAQMRQSYQDILEKRLSAKQYEWVMALGLSRFGGSRWNPRDPATIYAQLAWQYEDLHDLEKAESLYKQAVSLVPVPSARGLCYNEQQVIESYAFFLLHHGRKHQAQAFARRWNVCLELRPR